MFLNFPKKAMAAPTTSSLLLATATGWKAWSLYAGLLFGAFQMHLLPPGLARVVARVYFYPTWPFTYLARRANYWTLVDSHVFLGAAPMAFMPHVDALFARGVRAVVNLCDEYSGPVAQYKRLHIKQLRLPTLDHTEPSLQALELAVAFIQEQRDSGVRVYVHCKGGSGRSAAVAFCWLLHHRGMTPPEAQEYLAEKRRVRKTLYRQPNILAFYDNLRTQRASHAQG